MRFYDRLAFINPVLLLVGLVAGVTAYYKGGISELLPVVCVFVLASIAGILINVSLRKFRRRAGRSDLEKDATEGATEKPFRFVVRGDHYWGGAVFLAGFVGVGYRVGVVAGLVSTAVAILLVFLARRFVIRDTEKLKQ
jgi:membrane protein YqaA with SNARE-associated domain